MKTNKTVCHPLFARFFTKIATKGEALGVSQHRDELLKNLKGKLVEIGAGTGLNFSHYPDSVTKVIAVEPEPYLRAQAVKQAAYTKTSIQVVGGVGQALPFEDEVFDAAVASLVLCSVSSQENTLKEILRVLKPGGELAFYEHVLAENSTLSYIQHSVDLFWPTFGGGCHTSRDTIGAIEKAGFSNISYRRFVFRPCFLMLPVSPLVIGRAVKDKILGP
ncbi:MAG: methyltransferase domain-containing protein [Actinobacteria bacterium]|nr:methyltransferase domain-containing protein [Actinomycetota bacterium]MCL6104260.1 methyltransferase domain-containing protein [Actinomycetota bacterium]